MNTQDLNNISMNGRMAYSILCIEKYLLTKYQNDDWSILSNEMWKATSSYWDEWDETFLEIIPEYLFEFKSYEESDFEYLTKEKYNSFVSLLNNKSSEINEMLMSLHKLCEIYSFSSIPQNGQKASEIVIRLCNILESNNIPLPNIDTVSFSIFTEKNGWGNNFDGTKLSLILNN